MVVPAGAARALAEEERFVFHHSGAWRRDAGGAWRRALLGPAGSWKSGLWLEGGLRCCGGGVLRRAEVGGEGVLFRVEPGPSGPGVEEGMASSGMS